MQLSDPDTGETMEVPDAAARAQGDAGPLRAALLAVWLVRPSNWRDDDDQEQRDAWRGVQQALGLSDASR